MMTSEVRLELVRRKDRPKGHLGSRNKRIPPTATNMDGDATQLPETKTNFIHISDDGEVNFSPPTRINWS